MKNSHSKFIDTEEFNDYFYKAIKSLDSPVFERITQVGIDTKKERNTAMDFLSTIEGKEINEAHVIEYASFTSIAKLAIKSQSPEMYFLLENRVDEYIELLEF